MLLPASDLTQILTNLSALNLQPNTAAQILAAVLAPLLRNSGPDMDDPAPAIQKKRAGWPRGRPRRASGWRRRRKPRARRRTARSTDARERAIAAIRDNPNTSLTEIAKLAKCGYGTAVNARNDLAAEERHKPGETSKPAAPKADRRQRAQRFLRDELARGPKKVTDVEEAAAKAHVDPQTLDLARADLGIVVSRSNAGGVQAVQWSLPG